MKRLLIIVNEETLNAKPITDKLGRMLSQEYLGDTEKGLFPTATEVIPLVPQLPGKVNLIDGIRDMLFPADPNHSAYTVYVGSDVRDVADRPNGVEVPSSVLDDPDCFKREVVDRIRRYCSPINN